MMDSVEDISYPLKTESDLDPLIDQAGDKKAVLIGGATHGTSEFYRWRARITQRLIKEKGFSFVAVEGGWPSCYQVNRYVKDPPNSSRSARDVLYAFNRWPTWIWANLEVLDFIEWLTNHNKGLPGDRRVGFYGLDIYSLWESLSTAVNYLEKTTIPDAAEIARQAYWCLEPYRHDVEGYDWAVASVPEAITLLPEFCEDKVVRLLSSLEYFPPIGAADAEEKFNAEQNALVAVDAERYYRIILRGDPDSWNLREEHMANTFFRLLDLYEKDIEPKGILWAHDTHVGDARATDMVDIDRVSIGQLLRDRLEVGETYLIGFGSYQGSMIAAEDWGAAAREMTLPPAIYGSWEYVFHGFNQKDRMVLFPINKEGAQFFSESRGHRSVGVIYDPSAEFGSYVPTILSDRYDAFLYIDGTSALHPLHLKPEIKGPPETFPSAV
ncbi:MAG: erythromycin esterase family protein [Actinobacteria bacterium]|nr:erythromycin esterase family protein [Actinomycetota bacterium]